MDGRQAHRLILALALAAFALAALGLVLSTQSARAQAGDDIYVDKQLGRTDPVVHVGEYLTFTILIVATLLIPSSIILVSLFFVVWSFGIFGSLWGVRRRPRRVAKCIV